MRGIKKIWFFGLLVVAALFAQSASATYYLPGSSYENGAWRSSLIYEENGNVLIDFAVYDTDNLQPAGKIALAERLNMAGQYIYTYQIFDHPDDIYEEISYFGILDINGVQVGEALFKGDTGCYDDGSRRVAPTPKDSNARGTWIWTFDGGYMSRGEHSRFLVFSRKI
jgi:uncharacterized protein (UPF0333 family)